MTYPSLPPSLPNLVNLLRNPMTWPPGFEWNHRHPHNNAVGLTFRHWGGPKCYDDSNDDYVLILANKLGCTPEQCAAMLLTHMTSCQRTYGRGWFRAITPEMVADVLEASLGEKVKAPPNPLLSPVTA